MRSTIWYAKAGLVCGLLLLPGMAYCQNIEGDFLARPPLFMDNEPDVPLILMGSEIPKPGQIIPGIDSIITSSTEFRRNGVNVQPGLGVRLTTNRIGALAGLTPKWGAAASLPWQETHISGNISGFPASRSVTDIGNFSIFGKRVLWESCDGRDVVGFTAGVEFPTGSDTVTFDQLNRATTGYFRDTPGRAPLSWQPSTGSLNGFLSLAASRRGYRFSCMGILATKLHSSEGEDVKIGDIFIAGGTATYGIARPVALSMSVIYRNQQNDSYPNSPLDVDGLILQGTTQHGSTLYLIPSIRFVIGNKLVVGVGVKYPAILPENGLVPDTRGFLIIYPR